MTQGLFDDRDLDFLLYDAFDVEALCRLPHFAEHSRETFELYLAAARKFAREEVFPTYKPMDELGARFEGGRVHVHPAVRELVPKFAALGFVDRFRWMVSSFPRACLQWLRRTSWPRTAVPSGTAC